jgi:hypothetical protein
MTTLQDIWSASIDDINGYLQDNNIETNSLSDLDKYILVSIKQSEKNILSQFENDIINTNYFIDTMKSTEENPHNQRLVRGIAIIIKKYVMDNIDEMKEKEEREEINNRNPLCRYNDFNGNNPIDPITLEIITDLYHLNGRCYNKSTIINILTNGNKRDPFTRELIPVNVYNELGVNRNTINVVNVDNRPNVTNNISNNTVRALLNNQMRFNNLRERLRREQREQEEEEEKEE